MSAQVLVPGSMVWAKGRNDFGDGRKGGCVVRNDDNPDTGERFVVILTDSPAKSRQDSLLLHQSKGGYQQLGLVARLERMSLDDIDPHANDPFRSYSKVWDHAIKALRASTLPPHHRIGSRAHDDLLSAYRILRSEAELLQRGVT